MSDLDLTPSPNANAAPPETAEQTLITDDSTNLPGAATDAPSKTE